MAQMREMWVSGRPVSSTQALNCCWIFARSFRDVGVSAMSRPASRRQASDVGRGDEAVLADEAQEVLAGARAKPRAALGQYVEKPDLVAGRPAGQELAEAAVLARHFGHELRIVAHRRNLLRITDDALVAGEIAPKIVGLKQKALRLEAEERRLEARPLALDDAPHEACGEYALCHFRKHAVVGELGQRGRLRNLGKEGGELALTAFALGGTRADRLEGSHGPALGPPMNSYDDIQLGEPPFYPYGARQRLPSIRAKIAIPRAVGRKNVVR